MELGGGGLRVGRPLGCRRVVDGAVGEGRGEGKWRLKTERFR